MSPEQVQVPAQRKRDFGEMRRDMARIDAGLPPLSECRIAAIPPTEEPPTEVLGHGLPPELVQALAGLPGILAKLAGILDRMTETPGPKTAKAPIERLSLRAGEAADVIGISRRAFDRAVSRGELPAADRRVGKIGLWDRKTLESWKKGKR